MKNFVPFWLKTIAFVAAFHFGMAGLAGSAGAEIIKKYAHQPLNLLAKTASPYLLQHARDLVQWREWNEETLALAKKQGKPIFLSVGYSACHWCHVMQKESFNNKEVADLINTHFIAVLVDRERRPDLDETYMLATEAISGRGGWPNNVFMTPDLKPFYGGVYFPPADMKKLLGLIATDWTGNKMAIVLEADRIAAILSSFFNRKTEAKELTKKVIDGALKKVLARFDGFNGGMGTSPKHFNAPVLNFLLSKAAQEKGEKARTALLTTLKAIGDGGVNDQLAGGFHRYAIDNAWRIPHFEKMLYDQAMLGELFARASIITGEAWTARVAHKTYKYVLDDMTAPHGGFYSTRDADSEGEEGTYYVWDTSQIEKALGKDDAAFVIKTLGQVSEGDLAGKIIVHRNGELKGKDKSRFNAALEKLLVVRKSRIAPYRDEKIITGWNGLMISSFAKSARLLGNETYGKAAVRAAEFIWQNLRTKEGKLLRSFYKGKASVDATLPDYSYVADAFIDVYDLTQKQIWLKRAEAIVEQMDKSFLDKKIGDYFFTATKQGYARIKLRSDTAMPSANARALSVLVKLSKRSLDPTYSRRAEAMLAALSHDALGDAPGGSTTFVAAEQFLRGQAGSLQYAGRGRVRVQATFSADRTRVLFKGVLADKWHVNSDKPLVSDYIATKLDIKGTDANKKVAVKYPAAITRKLGFADKPLALFENRFEIVAKLGKRADGPVLGKLTLQACSDEICLLPETLTFRLVPPASDTKG